MTDEELKLKKQEYAELFQSRIAISTKRDELLEKEIVKEFVDTDNKLNATNKKCRSLYEEIIAAEQERCPHPAWYFYRYNEDTYEGKVYWTCKCVACGKELEDVRSRDYPRDRVIYKESFFAKPTISDMSYKEVADKWVKFMEDFPSEDKSIEEKGRVFTKMMIPTRVK